MHSKIKLLCSIIIIVLIIVKKTDGKIPLSQKQIIDNIYSNYDTKIKCVAQCFKEIISNNITSKSKQLKLIRESINNAGQIL